MRPRSPSVFVRFLVAVALASTFGVSFTAPSVSASTSEFTIETLTGPTGSGSFGVQTAVFSLNQNITVLPNGNVVVTDPGFDDGAVLNVGAVHVYDGDGLELLSTTKGSNANDAVGSEIYLLTGSSNFVIVSTEWDLGSPFTNQGAVTWFNGETGLPSGETPRQDKTYTVSISNSLIGKFNNDRVGGGGVFALTNGNYVVASPASNVIHGVDITDAGAVTWGNGTTGTVGEVNATNSLTGTSTFDRAGSVSKSDNSFGVVVLTNGNYIVSTPGWNDPNGPFVNSNPTPIVDVGAVTWVNGTNGFPARETSRGVIISSTNSLTGSTTLDYVGNVRSPVAAEGSSQVTWNGVFALTNGNYVVRSTLWNGQKGAATWGDGTTGTVGVVASNNSIVGDKTGDLVGITSGIALSNGNYIVVSSSWDLSPTITNVGAVTWGNGTAGTNGVVSESNSLVGSSVNDNVGNGGIVELANGNYVARSSDWDLDGSTTNVGAVTWGDGTTGVSGAISTTNSLHGTTTNDEVGKEGTVALTNGNYVVRSMSWDRITPSVITNSGAVTWGNGTTGISGPVTATNSLYGSYNEDRIGSATVTALTNGNYVVASPLANAVIGGAMGTDVGAVTWGNGTTGITGAVTTTNSLHGTRLNDNAGGVSDSSSRATVFALSNGNYVVRSVNWDLDGSTTNVGAVTWGNGTTGITGPITTTNSLHGTTTNDEVGSTGVIAIPNGHYLVFSRIWDLDGSTTNVGAVTWGNGTTGITGAVTTTNSLHGTTTNDEVGHDGSAAASYIIQSGPQQNNVVLRSSLWDNTETSPTAVDAGAVTLFNTSEDEPRTVGSISSANSAWGTTPSQRLGVTAPVRFDSTHNRVYVHSNGNNIVTILSFVVTPTQQTPPTPQTPEQPSQSLESAEPTPTAQQTPTTTTAPTSTPMATLRRLPQTGTPVSTNRTYLAGALLFIGAVLIRTASIRSRKWSSVNK